MNINKKSWHYWLYSHTYEEGKIPVSTNLCQYVRRLAISIPYIVLIAVCYVIAFVAKTIWDMVNGGIPTSLDIEKEPYIFMPEVKGVTIRPWYIIAPLILGYLYYQHTTTMLWLTAIGILIGIWQMFNFESATVVLFFGVLFYYYPVIALILIGIIIAIIIATHSETWNLAKECLKAQKRKICPIVEFQEN